MARDFDYLVSGRRGTEVMRVVRGWLEQSFAGREPTGRRVVAEAVHIFRVRDGRRGPGDRPRRPS